MSNKGFPHTEKITIYTHYDNSHCGEDCPYLEKISDRAYVCNLFDSGRIKTPYFNRKKPMLFRSSQCRKVFRLQETN